ncbi:MAG: hypothetical protein KF682_04720 [Nitrospira sp.]|nr:hypothetical protein [Nitrospira sp.]
MAQKGTNSAIKRRKVFGLSIDRQLMLDIQHMALDQDRYTNDLVEEALKDVLKKYREKEKNAK